jgi:hypothetical protein
MSLLDKFKNTLIYESQKEFYDERGRGARYRMTTVGVSFFKEAVGDMKDTQGLVKWMKDNGFVEEAEMEEDKVSVTLKVKGCCLKSITEGFTSRGKQPLSCPIANAVMYSMEQNGSMPPEITPIEFEDGWCRIRMAKIYTSDIV